jgi:hypothetical protein
MQEGRGALLQMNFDTLELSTGTFMAGAIIVVMCGVAAFVGEESYHASEKAAAYKAYVACLEAEKNQPIDVQQMFCAKIRDQL